MNLNGILRKNWGSQAVVREKIWGAMAHPGPPLESPLWVRILKIKINPFMPVRCCVVRCFLNYFNDGNSSSLYLQWKSLKSVAVCTPIYCLFTYSLYLYVCISDVVHDTLVVIVYKSAPIQVTTWHRVGDDKPSQCWKGANTEAKHQQNHLHSDIVVQKLYVVGEKLRFVKSIRHWYNEYKLDEDAHHWKKAKRLFLNKAWNELCNVMWANTYTAGNEIQNSIGIFTSNLEVLP